MINQPKSILLAVIIAVFIYEFTSSEPSRFEFDLKHVDGHQRDRLFVHLDQNKDKHLCQTEFKALFGSLFYSSVLKKSYTDEDIEQKILNLIFQTKTKPISQQLFDELVWDKWIVTILQPKSALIVVDVQNDFINVTNGSMPVTNGTHIIPVINHVMKLFDTVVFTYDWHPSNHCSFVDSVHNSSIDRPILKTIDDKPVKDLNISDWVYYKSHPKIKQYLWYTHCVQNSSGAELYPELNTDVKDRINVTKGMDPDLDSYSAFEDVDHIRNTTLDYELERRGITDIYLTGVLYEFCVGMTALDGVGPKRNYRTAFIENAIHELNVTQQQQMRTNLTHSYVNLITSQDVQPMINAYDRRPQMGYVLARKVFNKKHYHL